ncbi:MAG TPA: hypothetical protein VKD08_03785 [Ignavibacteriaceae bacterium]|jgi:hypothetical protein|nr:hypothetical protein [Ignavibacteriaceae bacterium]
MMEYILQYLVVIFLGGVATYDTLQSRRKVNKESKQETGEIFKLQN